MTSGGTTSFQQWSSKSLMEAPLARQMESGHPILAQPGAYQPERDDFPSHRHPLQVNCWSMIFSENRSPLFGFMLLALTSAPAAPIPRWSVGRTAAPARAERPPGRKVRAPRTNGAG